MTDIANRPSQATVPRVARTRGELARALAALRADGRSVALVPTMGALHDGHRALIRRAGELADAVVVSVFVNPLQFAPGEDLDRYPRPWDDDLAACTDEGVAVVFAPSVEVMYPDEPIVRVRAGAAGDLLEGAHRPGHFDGVLTVVAKLFNLVRPDVAVFGEKDAQQLALIRRMVSDLDVPVHVVGLPTVREPDGLARSSRNAYLSVDEHARALTLSRALFAGAAAADDGAWAVREAAGAVLDAADGVDLDYLELVDAATLRPVDSAFTGNALLLIAARVGSTRLIDNVAVVVGAPAPGTSAPGTPAPEKEVR
jgi:pantoate--beta-alanine ligase